jgi:glycosyltransferase involved in cell wall biosynthesis
MDRYWHELQRQAAASPVEDGRIFCPLGNAPAESHRAGPLRRALFKYLLYPWKASRLRADLVHLLDHSYAHLLPRLPRGVRSIATAFDLVPLADPRGLSEAQVRRFRKTVRNLSLADRVIAMSQQTERDLIRLAGVAPEKIRVIHPGTDVAAFAKRVDHFPSQASLPPDARLLLSVGDTGPRKNLPFLLDALAPLREDFRAGRCCLVRAGKLMEPGLAEDFRQLLGRGFLELSPRFGEELIGLYQRATVFLMPSTLEGFSFTMMEAMAAGVPVVANRISTNPEVGHDAVLYHENGDAAGAALQIKTLLQDEGLRQEYKSRGLARVAELTWERHWHAVKASYRAVLDRS